MTAPEQRLTDDLHAEADSINPAPALAVIRHRIETGRRVRRAFGVLAGFIRTAMNKQTGAEGSHPSAPDSPTTLRRSKDMAATVGGSGEDVSIVGTGITHVPMVGKPEFAGLLVGADGSAVARIEDGALCIEVADLDMAMAWRNAWHKAVTHLVQHRERKADQR